MVVQTPQMKLRDLGYFEFQLKMMNIVKTEIITKDWVVDNPLQEQLAKRFYIFVNFFVTT